MTNTAKIIAYCPSEGNAERKFIRVDNGIPIIGKYKCSSCRDIYLETNLQKGEENKDLVDLIREKLK